jgi:hypothetical protein
MDMTETQHGRRFAHVIGVYCGSSSGHFVNAENVQDTLFFHLHSIIKHVYTI